MRNVVKNSKTAGGGRSIGRSVANHIIAHSVATPTSLIGHVRAKHEKTFKCSSCGKCFENASRLKRHENTHDKTTKIACSQCNKFFSRNDYLKKHVKEKHNNWK